MSFSLFACLEKNSEEMFNFSLIRGWTIVNLDAQILLWADNCLAEHFIHFSDEN